MNEFHEGDLVLVRNEVIPPATDYMIDQFGNEILMVQGRYRDSTGRARYKLTKSYLSENASYVELFIWGRENLIPIQYCDVGFDGIDDLI